jgi:flagellar biosynthesis protein FliR
MSLFNLNLPEIMTFFAVLVRFSILMSVLPFVGDRLVPMLVKILLGLVLTLSLFPILVSSGQIHPSEAEIWGKSTNGIVTTIGLEVLFGLVLGFTARLIFDGITMGANLIGNFVGFGAATSFDPHQESQTEIIAQIQTTIAMLLFLTLDGHHLMLRASLESYRIVGLGKAVLGSSVSQRLIGMSGEVLKVGLQIAAPIAISMFSVNIVFGILSKAMPQLNIFVLSFALSAFVGFVVLFLCMPDLQEMMSVILSRIFDWMQSVAIAMSKG